MDPTTASYYRAILFGDPQDSRPVPPSLVKMHAFAFKRCQALGIHSVISRQSALAVGLTWLSSTAEGREFAREFTTIGDLFPEESDEQSYSPLSGGNDVDWDTIKPDTPVIVQHEGATLTGTLIKKRQAWIDVLVNNEKRHFRIPQVQLAGA
jgi:hypothetical protein